MTRDDLRPPTRDEAAYWDQKPDDHNAVGLFDLGRWEKTGQSVAPQEHRPSHYRDVQTGSANKAPETETREAILAREAEQKRARLRRMGLAIAGRRTGRNRKRKAA